MGRIPGKVGRPRGPNFEKNRKRMARWLEGQGPSVEVAATISGGESLSLSPEPAAFDARPLVQNFIKAMLQNGVVQRFNEALAQGETSKTYQVHDDREKLYKDGVMLRPNWRVKYEDLRRVTYAGNIVGSIIQLRIDDAKLHARPNKELGFWARLEDPDLEPTSGDRKRIKEKAKLVQNMGTRAAVDWYDREGLEQVLDMATADVYALDAISVLRTRNRKGETIDARYLDPATIFRVDPTIGYKGDRNITHVQLVDFQVVEVFERGRLVYRNRRSLSDRAYRGHGLSPTEAVIHEIMGSIYGIKANMDRWSGRNPPKFLMTTSQTVPAEVRELFEMIWESAYSGGRMGFQVPLIHNVPDFSLHKIDHENDIIWEKWMNWCNQMILARFATDEAELGLRLGQGQTLSEPRMEGRARLSRNREFGALMRFHEGWLNAVFPDLESEKRPLVLLFSGVTDEDKKAKNDRDIQRLSNFETLDQIRAERDLPAMKEVAKLVFPDDEEKQTKYAQLGGMIFNQHFAQQFGQLLGGDDSQQQDQEGEDPEDESEDDFDLDAALGFGEQDAESEGNDGGETEEETARDDESEGGEE